MGKVATEEGLKYPTVIFSDEFGVPHEVSLKDIIDEADTWVIGKGKKTVKVISYAGIKKIEKFCNVIICSDPAPKLLTQPSHDNMLQHVWGVWVQFAGQPTRKVFATGEASMLNTGRLIPDKANKGKMKVQQFGEVSAMYKSDMAFKRARCKAVLELCNITGVYSEVEAQDFIQPDESEKLDYGNL